MRFYTPNREEVVITSHVVKQARKRGIAFPDEVISTIRNGKKERFGKNLVRFVKKGKYGSLICVGEEIADKVMITKTRRSELSPH